MGRCSGTHLVVVDDVFEFGGLVLVQREQSQVEQGLCAQTANRDEIMKRCYVKMLSVVHINTFISECATGHNTSLL